MTVQMYPPEHLTADSVTLVVGTSSDSVTDLQVLNDGNNYHIDEANAVAPAQDLKIDFVNVVRFTKLAVKSYYKGSTSHYIQVSLYNWAANKWDVMITIEHSNGINYRFIDVADCDPYIQDSKVRMRFYHPETGILSHDTYIEYVALVR